jgi:hypothetical protein
MEQLCGCDLLPDMADLAGQVAVATGCAPVDVFLDEDFVRFILELDPEVLAYGDEYRGLYRLAMTGVLPEMLRTRRTKASFEPAIAAAASAANCQEELRDLASLRELESRGIVEETPFRPMFRDFLAVIAHGERNYALPMDAQVPRVWQLLSAEAFLREHGRDRDLLWTF